MPWREIFYLHDSDASIQRHSHQNHVSFHGEDADISEAWLQVSTALGAIIKRRSNKREVELIRHMYSQPLQPETLVHKNTESTIESDTVASQTDDDLSCTSPISILGF